MATVIRFRGAATVSHPASATSGQITNHRSRSIAPVARIVRALANIGSSRARSEAKMTMTLAAFRFSAAITIQKPMPKNATTEGQPMRLINTLSPVWGRA